MVARLGPPRDIDQTRIKQVLNATLIDRKVLIDKIAVLNYEMITEFEVPVSCLEESIPESQFLTAVLLRKRHKPLLLDPLQKQLPLLFLVFGKFLRVAPNEPLDLFGF